MGNVLFHADTNVQDLARPDDNLNVLNKLSISIMKYDGIKFVIPDTKFFLQDS